MVRKRDKDAPAPEAVVPKLPARVDPASLGSAVPKLDIGSYDFALAGSPYRWGDYEVGEKIDHVDGMTLEEAEHQIATRLYQNTAKVHFNQHTEAQGPLRQAHRVWRRRHLARPRAVVQRAQQRVPFGGDQRRKARRALLCRRHGLCVVGGAGEGGDAGPQGCRRAAHPSGRGKEPGLCGVPAARRPTASTTTA